jgi:circadian clock protein KaiB
MCIKKRPARRKRSTRWQLRVYVADRAARSTLTLANLERLCERHLPGHYRIEIIDLLRSPDRSREDDIVAVPTVVRLLPLPARRVIGTLADAERAVAGLEMPA